MQYVAAYALVALSNPTPSEADVTAVLKAAGVEADKARLSALFAELKGKSVDSLIAEGSSKLQTLGGGGGGGAAAPAAAAAAAPAAAAPGKAAAAAPAAKKAKAPEPEEDDDMGLGLFD